MLGRTISHYRIVSQLGAGGMGVVFSAEDVRLGRPVALKFVPEELARDDQAVERFRNEARAASALNHPHICTIYDIGEVDDRPFIVMELMKGHTLRDRLAAGPMKVHAIVDLGIEVADALDAAHAQGIVHRDIKPANLFLVDRGHVKIMDFGLAKLLPGHDGATTTGAARAHDLQTAPGVTLGTVAYMSPEQATGDELDGRTDLFSLGVVLYECATGHRPFEGNSSAAILTAILNRSPVAPVLYNPDLPLRLQDVINNCLEKDRDLRYQTAADLRADLRRVKRDLESGRSGAMVVSGSGRSRSPLSDAQNAVTGTAYAGGRSLSDATRLSTPSAATPDVATPAHGSAPAPALGSAPSAVAAPAPAGRRRLVGALAVALLVVGGVAVLSMLWPRRVEAPDAAPGPREPAAAVAPGNSPANAPANAPADTRTDVDAQLALATQSLEARNYRVALAHANAVLAIVPDQAAALQIRETAGAVVTRSDAAVADARRLLRTGNARAAARALAEARRIDPLAPGVVELSGLVADEFTSQAERAREAIERSRPAGRAAAPLPSAPSTSVPGSSPTAQSQAPAQGTVPAAPAPRPSNTQPPAPQPAAPSASPASPPAPVPAAPSPAGPPAPAATPIPAPPASATKPAPESASPSTVAKPPADSAPSDAEQDAAVRRVVSTYARAIETKDLGLFRSVKPNLTRDEEQRIEAGFRAVTSQRVAITILSIDRKGNEASVLLRRRDTIKAGGRRQTADSQQRMTLARTPAGAWVIVDIGR